ncbi:MAG: glycoside hydrolase family 78 protein [Bacteroidales bacterium]|nr:glycoside hydrolase family 78 protein [Bacteroidales bacterium]
MCILFAVCIFGSCTPALPVVYDLRCENLTDPLSIDNALPRFGWKTMFSANGEKATACQILVATDSALLQEETADLWNSGKIAPPASVTLQYAGRELTNRTLAYWRVRIWDSRDKASSWSRTACFGTGLTDAELRAADYIGLPKESGNPRSPLLRRQFEWRQNGGRTLLYVNSLGYHEVYINGKKAGDQVLAPAVSQLNKRSLYLTYDVSPCLQEGRNDLVIWLGQGWYQPGLPGVVHEGPLVKARLEEWRHGQWRTLLATDSTWRSAESGYSGTGTWRPHRFGGERVDASALPDDMTAPSLDKLLWRPVTAVDVPEHAVSPQMTESNFVTEQIRPADVKQLADSTWLADMGKALTGRVEIKFPDLRKGQEIILTYSDHLDGNGAPADQHQEDRYIASGKKNEVFCSKFNYHSFRYLKMSRLKTPPSIDDITGHLIQTGFDEAASFRCSDNDLNAIHDMIRHTLRCLSLGGYLTDCQHLERLGYGGDGNASTETAQTMFHLSPLYANWMQAWADCIREDGSMPHTAPNPYRAGGGPYWCGFVITASWRTYVNYGDARLIERYYPVMQQWLSYVERYSGGGLLQPWPETDYRSWYLGDWASPKGVDQTDKQSVDVVTNSFICVCYETMEKIARLLGKDADAKKYAASRERLATLIQEHFYSDEKKIYATGSQIDLAYPMLAQVTPEHLKAQVTESLFRETEQNRQGHIGCGLVGIPVVTEWAIKNRQPDFMYSMLKKRDYPGYLYMIDNGATATWEHWNGERSRIHNCYNAVGSWFYQAIGGVRPDENEPGYRKIRIDPQIPEGVTWAKTAKETPFGTLTVDWALKDRTLEMDLTVPYGSTACVVLPEGATGCTLNGRTVKADAERTVTLEGGKHQLTVKRQINQ